MDVKCVLKYSYDVSDLRSIWWLKGVVGASAGQEQYSGRDVYE